MISQSLFNLTVVSGDRRINADDNDIEVALVGDTPDTTDVPACRTDPQLSQVKYGSPDERDLDVVRRWGPPMRLATVKS